MARHPYYARGAACTDRIAGAIFAVAFAAVASIALAVGMSLRRQSSRAEEDQEKDADRSRPRPVAGRPANPRSGGEPVSGEG